MCKNNLVPTLFKGTILQIISWDYILYFGVFNKLLRYYYKKLK